MSGHDHFTPVNHKPRAPCMLGKRSEFSASSLDLKKERDKVALVGIGFLCRGDGLELLCTTRGPSLHLLKCVFVLFKRGLNEKKQRRW